MNSVAELSRVRDQHQAPEFLRIRLREFRLEDAPVRLQHCGGAHFAAIAVGFGLQLVAWPMVGDHLPHLRGRPDHFAVDGDRGQESGVRKQETGVRSQATERA